MTLTENAAGYLQKNTENTTRCVTNELVPIITGVFVCETASRHTETAGLSNPRPSLSKWAGHFGQLGLRPGCYLQGFLDCQECWRWESCI